MLAPSPASPGTTAAQPSVEGQLTVRTSSGRRSSALQSQYLTLREAAREDFLTPLLCRSALLCGTLKGLFMRYQERAQFPACFSSNEALQLPRTRPILGLIYWAPESCQQGVARKQNNNKKVNDLGFFFNK